MKSEPEHHARYRKAWDEYRTCFDETRAKELEHEMDTAQTCFTFNEFQKFKQTLLGFIEYWNDLPFLIIKRTLGDKNETDHL